jgi:lycopene cyclase domain-containing protein
LFFLLQPILTGLWLYWLLARLPEPIQQEHSPIVRTAGTIFWVVLSLAGAWMLQWNSGVYLGLILVWAGPVLALQWVIGASHLWAAKRTWLIGTLVPTLYLWIADRIAIGKGIWSIADAYTTGFHLFGLPLEEATFFLVTNLLVVQGLLLFLLLEKIPKIIWELSSPVFSQRGTKATRQL